MEGLYGKYGGRFGGVMGWEFFNAGCEREGKENWEWVRDVGSVYVKSSSAGAQQVPLGERAAGSATAGEVAARLRGLAIPGNVTVSETEAASTHGHRATAGEDAPSESAQFPEEHVNRLVELGFERPEAIAALEAMAGDVDSAAELLFGE